MTVASAATPALKATRGGSPDEAEPGKPSPFARCSPARARSHPPPAKDLTFKLPVGVIGDPTACAARPSWPGAKPPPKLVKRRGRRTARSGRTGRPTALRATAASGTGSKAPEVSSSSGHGAVTVPGGAPGVRRRGAPAASSRWAPRYQRTRRFSKGDVHVYSRVLSLSRLLAFAKFRTVMSADQSLDGHVYSTFKEEAAVEIWLANIHAIEPGGPVSPENTVSISLTSSQIAQVVRASYADKDRAVSALASLGDLQTKAERIDRAADSKHISRSALRALLVFAAFPPDGTYRALADGTKDVGYTPSTTHRYVSTWLAIGLLEQDPQTRQYRRPEASRAARA